MPSGREAAEQKWFKGWYEVVIKPAVQEASYEPVLAAAEEQPGAINDEIRTHLAVDPMVVVDLGGTEPEEDPNPNVMYELGIRHALGLPLVMLAWKGQRLPFDVSNQRVIMEDRDLIDLDNNKKKLVSFIRAAEQGKYYRPMEAVSRLATLEAASESLTEDSLLRALTQEIRDLRLAVNSVVQSPPPRRRFDTRRTVKRLIGSKVFRKDLYPQFLAGGGTVTTWPRVLRMELTPEEAERTHAWGLEEWKSFLLSRAAEVSPTSTSSSEPPVEVALDEDLLARVKAALPPQPWPDGIHRQVMETLGLSNALVKKSIAELIRRGDFLRQVDGILYPEDDRGPT